jgi:hypothetical protein
LLLRPEFCAAADAIVASLDLAIQAKTGKQRPLATQVAAQLLASDAARRRFEGEGRKRA